MAEATPFQFVYHHSYATSGMVVLHYKSCCSSLDEFQFIDIAFSKRGPNSTQHIPELVLHI